MSMEYGSKYVSKETNLNAFDWLKANLDSKTTLFLGSTSNYSSRVEFPLNHLLDHLLDHLLALKLNLKKLAVDSCLQNNLLLQ